MIVRSVTKIPLRGTKVTPEAMRDWDGTPWGKTRAELDVWVAYRLLAGMRPEAAVVASGGTMSLRSAYRWRKALVELQVVEMAGYRATFAVRRNGPPARLTAWEAA